MLLAATHTVSGLPAVLILLVVLALLVVGAVVLVRTVFRGGKRAVRAVADHDGPPRR
jgi:hypothetical protein